MSADSKVALSHSRRMPIAVAAGIATGVLVGLLLLRSGESAQAAQNGPRPVTTVANTPTKVAGDGSTGDKAQKNEVKAPPKDDKEAAPAPDAAPVVARAEPDAAVKPVQPAPAETATATNEAERDRDRPEVIRQDVTLTFDVTPPTARNLVIRVDGERVRGTEYALTFAGERKRVRIVARATGFLTWRRRVTVRGDDTIHIRLRRPSISEDEGPGSLLDF